MKSKAACLSPQEIEIRLKEKGIQPTAQRIAICRYLLCEADHPTADEVKAWADRNLPKVSLATVYNTLGTLVEAGLLKELKLPHSDKVIYDDRVSDHHHFLDEATGRILDVSPEALEVKPKLGEGFEVSGVEVLIRGRVIPTRK
jgi:Fur family iron response transcriptional regulator